METNSYFLPRRMSSKCYLNHLFGRAGNFPVLRYSILAGQSATLKRWSRPRAHLAGVDLQFADWTDEFGFDRVAAGRVDQFHRDARASSHPTIAPLGHRSDQGIEVKSFFREAILESTRVLFVRDTPKNSVAHQLTQPVRQAVRCQAQILLNRVELSDAEEDIADDQHGPAVADDRQRSGHRAGHRVDLLPAHLGMIFSQPLIQN